jgi:predicted glycoside hydrolase/deacetylase ChbG (UPF0249 family)
MIPNPYLKELGFEEDDGVVVIHADDVGMCQATVTAFEDLFEIGSVSSGAVMVPCPWFLHVAAYCKDHSTTDMGVHLTLTSEWNTYRWGPVSTCDPTTGLLDDEGYFHHRVHQVHRHGDPRAVQSELKAQLIRAQKAGIDVTHIDNHMGSLAHPRFLPAYIELSQQFHLPGMIPVGGKEDWSALGLDPETASKAAIFVREKVNAHELIQIDHAIGLRLDQPEERLAQAKSAFDSMEPGLTHLAIHPAMDTPELRSATPSTWQCRVGDYEVFRSDELRNHIWNLGIQVIGYRPLRDLIQSA